ncbi:MAG TPA: energy transducer TonB [Chitinophagaceae bacterium]
MEPKQILSANLLDIIFDDRNKAYGAYELRVTYPERIKKSLLFTFAVALLAFTGAAMAKSFRPKAPGRIEYKEVTLSNIDQEEKKPEPLPEPPKKADPPQVQTERFTQPVVVDDTEADTPPPTQDDLATSKIDVFAQKGIDDDFLAEPKDLDKGANIIEQKKVTEPEIHSVVQVDAKYKGNWEKFLLRNLNANIPVDNGAPEGRYKVVIRFVVDLDGNVSDIQALTNHGYGMEQEAIRVLKKANGWEPAFQYDRHVKAYRMQPITFEVVSE